MSVVVRSFTYSGLMTANVVNSGGGRYSSDSVFLLKPPYLSNETLTANTVTAVTSAVATSTPNEIRLLQVQVAPGGRVHYEVTPQGHTLREATTDSPVISGDQLMHFGTGWRISFLEAA